MIEFTPFPKIARLNRDIVVTEKIDGTNAAIGITEEGEVYAQSRSRLIDPNNDNFGFARWVYSNAEILKSILGTGLHFGEWWGQGIQRGYGLDHKRFSLFNTAKWEGVYVSVGDAKLTCTPILYEGPFSQHMIEDRVQHLRLHGSKAVPGFMRPEGVVIFHTASREMFKVTLEKDEAPKSLASAA